MIKDKDWVCLVETEHHTTLAMYNPGDQCWYRYSDGTLIHNKILSHVSLSDVPWLYVRWDHIDTEMHTTYTYPRDSDVLCVVQLGSGCLSLAYCLHEGRWMKTDKQRVIRGDVEKFIQVSDIHGNS